MIGMRRGLTATLRIMMFVRTRMLRTSSAAFGLAAALSACAGHAASNVSTAPSPTADAPSVGQRVVASQSGRTIAFSQMADAAARADVVFIGEQHDDAETHRAELALLTAIGERRTNVVLSLEMFERDVQPLVNAYLSGALSEPDFREQSRPWPNYGVDYRPLVELAKAKKWPVVASNVPRRLASMVSHRGLTSVDSLVPAERALVAAELLCPKDQYYTNFVEIMGGGHGGASQPSAPSPMSMPTMTDLFYQAQCIKDETMAESIATARMKAGSDAIIVHVTGSFHTDFGLGTVARVRRRSPDVKTIVVSAVPTPAPASANAAEFTDRGQFIIFVLRKTP